VFEVLGDVVGVERPALAGVGGDRDRAGAGVGVGDVAEDAVVDVVVAVVASGDDALADPEVA
jgi:hypothetical protein